MALSLFKGSIGSSVGVDCGRGGEGMASSRNSSISCRISSFDLFLKSNCFCISRDIS